MARSKSDVSNSAIRIFLQKVGDFYDRQRGYDPFKPKVAQSEELLRFFGFKCCYCFVEIGLGNYSQDHLIPMNKEHLGLHAWGNVVPCCRDCNNKKLNKSWEAFLLATAGSTHYKSRYDKIMRFRIQMKYDPQLDLLRIAGNLYEDIGEVTMTMINLRYKQAEEEIKKLTRIRMNSKK
jgi:hypothetical protein